MTAHNGYLMIADISGYTAYMTSAEQQHANPILRSLLSSLVEQIGDPLHLWKLEGDAVLAYTDHKDFPSGETFLGICENIYNAFSMRRLNIIQNTTCECRACANVKNLDLKIVAHHGTFETIQVGPITDISGADVILVHRMAKSDVRGVTGIESYAMFSEAAVAAMDVDAALTPYSQTFEHFGEVGMQVYDLAAAWERFRDVQERHFLKEEDGVCTYRRFLPYPRRVVWEALVTPEMKRAWMGMLDVTVDRPKGRIGPGSGYHCAHEAMDFYYWVSDWRPFDYFSTNSAHPAREGISFQETYAVTEAEGGTEVRWTMTACRDKAGAVHEDATKEVVDILSAFWPPVFDTLEEMLKA